MSATGIQEATGTSATALVNLQAAFNGETAARSYYLAYAEKADQEGFGPVASLFRAAARSEEIHAASHAAVIREMGGAPEATIETPVVGSTRENLEAAIRAEAFERDILYPAFLNQARTEGHKGAQRTFFLAREVEAEHARLCRQALDALESKKGQPMPHYVCPVCGFITETVDFCDCAICDALAEDFVQVR